MRLEQLLQFHTNLRAAHHSSVQRGQCGAVRCRGVGVPSKHMHRNAAVGRKNTAKCSSKKAGNGASEATARRGVAREDGEKKTSELARFCWRLPSKRQQRPCKLFFFFTHHFSTSSFLFSPYFYSWVLLLCGAGRELRRRLFMQLWLFLKLPLIHIFHKGGPFLPNLRGKGCRRADAYICGACAVRCPVALLHTTREAHCFCQMCDWILSSRRWFVENTSFKREYNKDFWLFILIFSSSLDYSWIYNFARIVWLWTTLSVDKNQFSTEVVQNRVDWMEHCYQRNFSGIFVITTEYNN